jgi:serine/threonine protein kinase
MRGLCCRQVKIADFGLAKQSADAMSTVCGTPQYVAPEVIQGTANTVYGPEVSPPGHLC